MPNFRHQGVVTTNGHVDTAHEITDAATLQVQPADDAFRLPSLDIGHFEWWYFDVTDARNNYVLKLVAHLGTDPLRTRCYPSVSVSVYTPDGTQSIIMPFAKEDFEASREACDVRIKDAFHTWVVYADNHQTYHVSVRLPSFSADLQFQGRLGGWKPLGDHVPMQQRGKAALFDWVIPLPRAEVVGMFCSQGVTYQLEEALGYHDHNLWQVDSQAKLFLDQSISHWHWGRFLGNDITVVFMDTCFRTHHLRSCLIARNGSMCHSSNNHIEVVADQEAQATAIRATYPTHIEITLPEAPCTFQMSLTQRAVIDSRDLLDGVSPLLKWLIRQMIAQPSYHGILADAAVCLGGTTLYGKALYESIYFRRSSEYRCARRALSDPMAI